MKLCRRTYKQTETVIYRHEDHSLATRYQAVASATGILPSEIEASAREPYKDWSTTSLTRLPDFFR